ncbi:unnamed protein product [Adineta steineri]|uniref:EF-hand domain-containing protein n=1 Tax=Adineta steineri TaxID=433720 RepID=A0A814RAD0_9BILA|nr:unnamed protein product [Adineta steineri]CAF1210881.1 unnamed protein product [Adineta steineri]CAF1384699.1 unnamed protein product [Adineta steineri]CAF3835590.1 unnamed protein product [Adineta steineri]CAF3928788.1 unnamed protein product [Adineta steineri]
MSDQQINLTQLLDTFQLFDKNKDGSISMNELRSACQKLHMPIEEKKLRDLFQFRNNISFDEFCRIIHDFGHYSPDAYFQETFRAFDKNSDGFISAKEIKKTMKELGETLTDKQVKDMIKIADSNGDGKLSVDEFRILFNYLTQFTTTSPSITINSIQQEQI